MESSDRKKRDLFECVMQDLKRYCGFDEHSEAISNLTFAVFSYEPFGFVFPDKESLKKISAKALSKQYFKRDYAEQKYKDILVKATAIPLGSDVQSYFLSELEKNQDELSIWYVLVHGIAKLKSLLNDYMPDHNVCWNCERIGDGPNDLFSIRLWIILEAESMSAYRNLYKPK